MCIRDRVYYVQESESLEERIDELLSSGFSRIPVLRDDQLMGVLHVKDLIPFRWMRDNIPTITALMRPTLTTSERVPLRLLLEQFKAQRKHLAVVLNLKRTPIGLCTMEDLIEELIGPIDEEAP